ncbi:MAG: hypothetical protein ACR2QJ_13825 [Geminicoccaceae bacterium]
MREILGDFDVEDLTRQAVRHALAKERQHQHLTLHVAPGLIDGMRADLDTEIDPEWRRLISVEPGSDDDRGRCRLASEIGFVDLGIEAQLRALHQGLMDGLDRQVEE